jgi:hypothetical protein
MTKTNFLNNIRDVKFNVSYQAEDFLISIYSNEIETLNIAGGIPENGTNDILHSADYLNNTNSLFFSSESELFVIEREVFWDDKFIDNKFLIVFSTGKKLGTFIFLNEVIQARKLGISCLKVSAAKSERFNGYYTWARLGYTIDSPEDQADFEKLLRSYGRSENSMINLMQTSDGRNFWRNNGFWWQGIFDLSPNSENIQAFNNYLAETGIDLVL